jgi:hypothetical protein
MAWACVALGLAEKDKAGALEAVDRAIQEIDYLRESGPGAERIPIFRDVRLMYPTNPAALILPVVERAAPDRLDEVFWRAVALHPRLGPDQMRELQYSYIGFECILLVRYDRSVAAALFAPIDAHLRSLAARKGQRSAYAYSHLLAKGCIDPPAAVALLESLTPRDRLSTQPGRFDPSTPDHTARINLAPALGLPPEKRWKYLWSRMRMQLPIDD